VSTLQEIKTAIAHLKPSDQALLAAELFARDGEPDDAQLKEAIEAGWADVEAGRVRPLEGVKALLPQWISKS
jgi:predicted transcriptional regulator